MRTTLNAIIILLTISITISTTTFAQDIEMNGGGGEIPISGGDAQTSQAQPKKLSFFSMAIIQLLSSSNAVLFMLLAYVVFLVAPFCIFMIAKKLDEHKANAWMGFVPGLNALLLLKIANKSPLWIIGLAASIISIITSIFLFRFETWQLIVLVAGYAVGAGIGTYVSLDVARARHLKASWGALMGILPIVGFFIVAFAEPVDNSAA